MIATIVAFLANSLTITIFLAYLFALWAALVGWTWFDISARTDNILYKLGAILIVATGALFGFAIYLLLRPTYTKEEARMKEIEEALLASQSGFLSCPSCHFAVREDFVFCPDCSFKLQSKCSNCDRGINVSWNACPYCGKEQKAPFQPAPLEAPQVPTITEPVVSGKGRSFALFSTLSSFLKRQNVKKRSKSARSRGTTFGKAKKAPRTARKKKS